jgi:penicillin-binding protein 2
VPLGIHATPIFVRPTEEFLKIRLIILLLTLMIRWKTYLNEFGFGNKLGTDFVNELKGFIPSTEYFDKYYGKNRWKALTVISMAIGQGEVGTTPLQMANMTAAIANRGYYYTPHIVKSVGPDHLIDKRFTTKHQIDIDPANFEQIVLGMEEAVK